MNRQVFAGHLGFTSWEQLLDASEVVYREDGLTWYLTQTATWYKWVVWNTHYDMYFNYATQSAARKFAQSTRQRLQKQKHSSAP